MNNAVSSEFRDILTELFAIFDSKSFYLAGGTNLALKYNHRVSTVIDLFLMDKEVKNLESVCLIKLKNTFKDRLVVKSITKDALRLSFDSVKVDFLQWSNIKKMVFEPKIFEKPIEN